MERPEDQPGPAIRFRSSKKRKTYRQRPDSDTQAAAQSQPQPPSQDEEAEAAVTTAIRLRNARKARLRGVGFTSDTHDEPATPTDEDKTLAKGIPDRFTHQTGLIATLNDRHMTEYIESRLTSSAPKPSQPSPSTAETHAPTPRDQSARQVHEQPTKHGKLLEVEVPLDVRRDTRPKAEETQKPRKRGRNRRGSDDIKRDQLVEAFLHENKLDVYDVPVQSHPTGGAGDGDGRSADDRMADEFRQRYLDEVAARRLRKRPAQMAKQQQQQQADVLKGPKLGGSRNVRAAARDILLKQEKEKSGRRP
ncbi:hypothetical protein ED733_008103 [Metarhizium rileyi]|uniref:mRNA splicing factor RNA helicase n=1 Tax=Metarhizium rileyi (strain RCEF 4871) TaxID=1649241 RepID=A0A5C6GLL3_METRR|nr:hypothetical protein ED733_008103 [Metarhizium rileyi]